VLFLSCRVLCCCGVVLVVSCVVLFLWCVCVCGLFLFLHPPVCLFTFTGPVGVSLIARALADHPGQCAKLNLRCTDAGPAGAEALAVTLRADGCALRYIYIHLSIYILQICIYICIYLARLNLRCTDAEPAGAEALAVTQLRDQVYIHTHTPLSLFIYV